MTEWVRIPLAEVAEVFNGKTPSKSEQRSHGHPVLKIKDVSDLGEFRGTFDSFVDADLAHVYADKRLCEGDTLILNAAHNADYVASKTYRVQRPAAGALATGEWLIIRPAGSRLDPGFAFHWVNNSVARRAIRDMVKGIHLYPKDVARLRIPLPSLPEQRRIAQILDKADALRAKRRAALAQLDTLTQAIYVDMFGDPATNPKGWPRETVGNLASKFSDGPFGSNLKTEHYTDVGVRVVRLQNIGVGQFLNEDKSYISEEHFDSLKKHECLPGDVLVGTLGDPNVRACIQPDWLLRALNKADCVQLRPNRRVANADYLCALLNHPSTERMAQGLILGQTRSRISMGRLRGLLVPRPPIELQSAFSCAVASARSARQSLASSAAALNALFVSIQQRAFRGDL